MEVSLSTLVLWFLWPAVIGFVAYWYLTRNNYYWKERGVPYVPPLPVAGSLIGSFSKPLHEEETIRYKKYGRLYGHFEGMQPVLNIADPALLRDVLVKDFQFFPARRNFSVGEPITSKMVATLEGEDWKRVRSIITPAFTTGKIKRMLGIFKDCARTLSNNFREAAKAGKPINAKQLFGAFSMDIIASSAFSTKLDSHNDPTNRFVTMAWENFNVKFPWRIFLFFMCPSFMRFFKISVFSPAPIKFFGDVTMQIIKERERTGQTRNDFLQLLLDIAKEANEEEGKKEEKKEVAKEKKELKEDMEEREQITGNYGTEDNNDIFKQYLKKKSLSTDELVAQCVIFFLAGYDTTASTLSFASYNLALNPDCQERLIQEIDDAVRDAGGEITYEAVQNLKYLDNVISETLRLFSPAIKLDRTTEEDYKLGDTGIIIPKGMLISIPIYAMHRDPEFFPDPEKFDPDRFTTEEKSKRDPYTYMPFGAGPRNCLGMRFALVEMKVCLAYVFSHFRVRRCPETKVPMEFSHSQGLLQPKDITVMFEVRTDGVLKN